ncbi:MAG: cation:dicarboxylase symporter family transporter [Candidatus Dadabacteria bacterium]|nr:cation:dicarboxylase symporter family transporter [Candidatus Dadabacteria bacterium]NIQ14029.1 cation:dicarboxylase symporter family transporter [Candidatus Dadabacteria bacterium]
MKTFLLNNKLIIGIIIGVILGGLVGTFWPDTGSNMKILGELFLNALKMIVIPLIIISITLSIMKVGNLGSVGLKTIIYYVVTTAIAVLIGIFVVTIIQPGDGTTLISGELPEIVKSKEGFKASDILRQISTPNLFKSAYDFQILPLIIASILFGIAFGKLKKKNELILPFFEIVDSAIMKIVHWIIVLTPIGIFGLIAGKLGSAGGGKEVITLVMQIGKYVFSVILGLLIHGLIVLPLILMLFARRNPVEYFKQLSETLLTAFSTASSSATLPLTMTNVIEGAKVKPRIGKFVLPLGATINMDGTALYEAVAVIFIAQSYGISLGGVELVIVFLTATLAAIGAAGIPEAGLVTMVLVLQAVGLPLEGIGLILAIDWLLDRFRTTVNVWGDSVGAAVIDKVETNNQ